MATLKYKQTKSTSAVMSELAQLRFGQELLLTIIMINVPHVSVLYGVVIWYSC